MDIDELPPSPPTSRATSTWPAPSVSDTGTVVRVRPRLSAAGWLAATGAALLLVASVIVVAGSWESIDPVVRFSGLVAALLAIFFVAESGRVRFPTTARSLAALAACLSAPVGVAAAATLGQPWPICTLVGGGAALAATELQARRWNLAVLRAATVAAFGLAAVGTSAATGIPAPLIGAVGAAGWLLLGSTRRSLALASAAGASPLLVALANTGIGIGTLDRIGATGGSLVWSAPLSGTIAAVVIGVIAHRSQNAPLAVASLGVFATGVVTAFVSGDVASAIWWCVPALVLLASESVAALRVDSVWRRLARTTSTPLGVGVAAAALASPCIAFVARWDASPTTVAATGWWAPLAIMSVALIAATAGTIRREPSVWKSAMPLAASAAAISTLLMAGAPLWTVAFGTLVGWLAVTAATPWSHWDATTAVMATWVLLAAWIDEGSGGFWSGAVIAAAIAAAIAVSVIGRNDAGGRLLAVAAIAAPCAAILADSAGWAPDLVGLTVFVSLVGIGAAIRPEQSVLPLGVSAYVVARAVTDDPDPIDWFDVSLVAILAGAVAASARTITGGRAQVAAALTTIAGGLGLAAGGVDAGTGAVAASLVGVAASGLALLDRRLAAGHTVGITATVVAVIAGLEASDVFTSMAVAMLGAQIVVVGVVRSRMPVIAAGGALSLGATLSLWWTTGTNSWVLDGIEQYGADGSDVALAMASALLLAAGAFLRRSAAASSWLAYSPGLGMAGTWMIATQLEPGTDWATFGALIVGVVAVAIGGVRRLGAPLVLGTLMVVGTIVVSAGDRLAAAPTWAWIAVGGTALLVVAALIERSERPLLPLGRRDDDPESMLERFFEEFR